MNKLKNLSLACLNFESSAKQMPYGRKFNIWDTYTWTEQILPSIEEQTVYDNYYTIRDPALAVPVVMPGSNGPGGDDERMRKARHSQIAVFYCPSDATPIPNEIGSGAFGLYRANYRGCVGAGTMYGGRPALPSVLTAEHLAAVNADSNAFIGSFRGQGCWSIPREELRRSGRSAESAFEIYRRHVGDTLAFGVHFTHRARLGRAYREHDLRQHGGRVVLSG